MLLSILRDISIVCIMMMVVVQAFLFALVLMATRVIVPSAFPCCRLTRRQTSAIHGVKSSATRREPVQTVLSWTIMVPLSSRAAETVGKDDNCNDSMCLGVWDGLFADCPHNGNPTLPGASYLLKSGAGCVSSQDDTPGIFSEP